MVKVLICGMAHAHTSAVAKFLYDNGGDFGEITHNVNKVATYKKYESKELEDWIKNKRRFKSLVFPDFEGVRKEASASFFIDDVPENVKIVFCFRNPLDMVESYKEKYDKPYCYTLNYFYHIYHLIARAKHNIYTLQTERLLNGNKHEIRKLLEFCELSPKIVIFRLERVNKRPINFFRYRYLNFWIKRIKL